MQAESDIPGLRGGCGGSPRGGGSPVLKAMAVVRVGVGVIYSFFRVFSELSGVYVSKIRVFSEFFQSLHY